MRLSSNGCFGGSKKERADLSKKVSIKAIFLCLPFILSLTFSDSLSDLNYLSGKSAAAVLCSQVEGDEDHAFPKNNALQTLDIIPDKTPFQFFPSNSNQGTSSIISYSSQIIVISCGDRAPPAV